MRRFFISNDVLDSLAESADNLKMNGFRRNLSICVLATATTLALPASGARFTFDPSRGLVELEGTVNGYLKGRFGIDTGADGFYLDAAFARRAGLDISEPDQERRVAGVDGYSELRHAVLRSFAVGDERIYNVSADIIDLNSLTNAQSAPPDGLIGHEILRRFYVTVDYPNRRLDLFTHEPRLEASDHFVVPFDRKSAMIYVEVSIDRKPPLTLLLDYCASATIVTPPALERIGLSAESDRRQMANTMKLNDIQAENVSYYVRDLENMNARGRKLDGILGYSFLRRFTLTIDYGRGLLFFER